ncbi:killer cell lectin-like receptor 5 [Microtus oregoni]|uniref:killer cell lectin-like receptor 5 n=1 Tax=Microtus oregoni TaxID=111838 RepID=UPI001BB29F29|nr:killer cell lectin-like receptor 5 [Microtus oregoni]
MRLKVPERLATKLQLIASGEPWDGPGDDSLASSGAFRVISLTISLHLIAVAFGFLCLLLMLAMAVWLTNIFQYSQEKHKVQKTLNNLNFYNFSQDSGNNHELQKTLNSLTQQYHILQSNNSLIKEMLRNKSRELDDFKPQKELDSSNREKNRCCGESKVFDCIQLRGKYVDGYWFCSGIKCYFIMDKQDWSGCKQTCQDYSLSLLKIYDDDELKFLQVKVNPNTYWIGLSYDTGKSKWQWIDNGPSNLDSKIANLSLKPGRCAFLSRTRLDDTKCEDHYPCICEMRMDKFPNSPSRKK